MEASRAAFLIGIAMLIGGFSAGFLGGSWEEVEPGHFVLRDPLVILFFIGFLGFILMMAGAIYHFVWKRG